MSGAGGSWQLARGVYDLLADWRAGAGELRLPVWPGGPDWSQGHVVLTHSARDAIKLAALSWGLRSGDEVLVPAYNCGCEISPFTSMGVTVSLYRVTARAEIDIDDLLSRIRPRTRVVYVTHYFGAPAGGPELVAACHARGVKIIEDCALSLFSAGVGSLGDATVFSLRKSLPAADGGLLILRSDPLDPTGCAGPNWLAVAKGAASLVKNALGVSFPRRGAGPKGQAEGPSLPDLPPAYYETNPGRPRGGSRLAQGILACTDPASVLERRRSNYQALAEGLTDAPAVTLFWKDPLQAGVCPLGLPVLVRDKRTWCAALSSAGIPVPPWWEGCHRGLDWASFPEALTLKRHMLLLPVHQGLTSHDMTYVADVCRTLARRSDVNVSEGLRDDGVAGSVFPA